MSIRGTSLLLRLSTAVPEGLGKAFGGTTGEELLAALHEDLLDMISTWRRVGREREVVVLLDANDDAAMRRSARRGLTTETGFVTDAQLIGRVQLALSTHRVVAVLDQPAPDFALADVDRLVRKAHEGIALVADLEGGWTAFALDASAREVLGTSGEIGEIVECARLEDVVIHALTPMGRIDRRDELEALSFRIDQQRARAPRTRRFLAALDGQVS